MEYAAAIDVCLVWLAGNFLSIQSMQSSSERIPTGYSGKVARLAGHLIRVLHDLGQMVDGTRNTVEDAWKTLALGIVVVSICKSFSLKDEKKMLKGIEIPAFLLAVAIALQIGLGSGWFLSSIVSAWIASIVSASLEGVELSNIPIKSMLRRILQSIKPSDMPEQCLVWPLTVLLALAFPILVLAQLLFDGMEDSQSDGK